jgi:hypothetical protein
MAENAPHGLLAGRRVYAFDGAHGFGDEHTRYLSAVLPREGWSDEDLHFYVPPFADAGRLVAAAVAQGGADREKVRQAVWEIGGFDEHGDPPDPRVGVWRRDRDGRLICETVW